VIDTVLATQAFRDRCRELVVATTGSATLSATSTGYARSAGSFKDEGFVAGMELTLVTGFSTAGNNQATTAQGRIITAVSDTTLSCAGTTAEDAASGRVLTVGLPFRRAWENLRPETPKGFPYVDEDFLPGVPQLITAPFDGGTVEELGAYVLKWYGLENRDVASIARCADKLVLLFTPGTTLLAGTTPVVMRGDSAARRGQVLPQGDGRAVCVIEIPWRAHTSNARAA
jgi:hypothetical protein